MAKKRTKTQRHTRTREDRGIYQDIVVRDDGQELLRIPATMQPYNDPTNIGAVIMEALESGDQLASLYVMMISRTKAGNDIDGVALWAFRLGRVMERLAVLPVEPAALTGKKCRSGGAAGAQAKRLTSAKKQAKTDLYIAGLEALRKKHPSLKQEALINKLARQLGQGHGVRTIKTYLPKSK